MGCDKCAYLWGKKPWTTFAKMKDIGNLILCLEIDYEGRPISRFAYVRTPEEISIDWCPLYYILISDISEEKKKYFYRYNLVTETDRQTDNSTRSTNSSVHPFFVLTSRLYTKNGCTEDQSCNCNTILLSRTTAYNNGWAR